MRASALRSASTLLVLMATGCLPEPPPRSGDCSPSPVVKPGAVDVCDGVDNDCDGQVDEDAAESAFVWYADADGDGYGDPDVTTVCGLGGGWSLDPGDCDDTDPFVHPGVTDGGDGWDSDCDGRLDDDGCWFDQDGDGYGDPAMGGYCGSPGWVENDRDCAPDDAAINPRERDACDDATDSDCDGLVEACWPNADVWGLGDLHATWFGDLGHELTPVGASGDYDGDGLADLVLGAPGANGGAGALVIVAGPEIGGPVAAGTRLDAPGAEGGFGVSAAAADLDVDGWTDLVVASDGGGGMVDVIYGPSPDASAALRLTGPGVGADLSVVPAGDVAGPARSAAVVAPQWPPTRAAVGAVFLLGLPNGATSVEGMATARLTGSLSTVIDGPAAFADFDGDGQDDAAVAVEGRVVVAAGPFSGVVQLVDADWELERPSGGGLVAADLDDDGYGDLAVGAPSLQTGGFSMHLGPPRSGAFLDVGTVVGPPGVTGVGAQLALADVDHDGFPGVIASGDSWSLVYASPAPLITLAGLSAGEVVPDGVLDLDGRTGAPIVVSVGDVNADGAEDVAYGWPHYALTGLGAVGTVSLLLGEP
jgi:hypothetical protein